MILVFSFNHIEEPTNDVIDWLKYYNANFIRVNGEDTYIDCDYSIDFENYKFKNQKVSLELDEVTTVFYRRWFKLLNDTTLHDEFVSQQYTEQDVRMVGKYLYFLGIEYSASVTALYDLLSDSHWYPEIENIKREKQKQEVLNVVKKHNIKIPNTIITTKKEDVIEFKAKHKKIITKPIKDIQPIYVGRTEINMYTKEVTDEVIEEMPESFFPSLYQAQVDKFFEIRTFFIDDEFYSMLIFSQLDEKTKVDFRNYNHTKPNRFVPFKLPEEVERNIYNAMRELGINTGSIDLILTPNGEYYFLEVNIVGQLGMVSHACNYYLEDIIAQKLITHDAEKRNTKKTQSSRD